ncbi:MAG TPA: histidine kinase, partial [Erysipelothrix sp.]|nr:histidine kinase [Erysipelothrix sp.]
MKHKTGYMSFEDKIKRSFQSYARILLMVLFVLLTLFISFELIIKPNFKAYLATKEIESELDNLHDVTQSLFTDLKEVESQSQFYSIYYDYLVTHNLRGDLSIYNESDKILYITNTAQEGSFYNKTYTAAFRRNVENADGQLISTSMFDRDTSEGISQLILGQSIENKQGENIIALFYIEPESINLMLPYSSVQSFVLTDARNYVLARSHPIQDRPLNRFNLQEDKQVQIDNRNFKVQVKNHKVPAIKIYVLTEKVSFNNLFTYLMIMMAIVLYVQYLAGKKVSKQVGKDASSAIDQLKQVVEKIGEGDLGLTLDLQTEDEFESLGRAFNRMSLQLDELVKHNEALGEMHKRAEIKQLEAQFNPHFLYNSLETIRYLLVSDPKLAQNLILNITTLLRYSIEYNDELVNFKEDLIFIRLYLEIQQIRLNDRLKYEIDIDPEILDEGIPKLILQPLIENSIKHGFNQQESLEIKIKGTIEGDYMMFEIK